MAEAIQTLTTPLLTPYSMGKFKLSHRIVLAPLSRLRMVGNVPQPHAILYYSQRASPGGLLISEGTAASETAHPYSEMPGIWTKEQVEAWKPIVKAVHDKGGVFFCQIEHIPYVSANEDEANEAGPLSSREKLEALPAFDGGHCRSPPTPHQIPVEDISDIVNDFKLAARNAIEAGFDGVEIVGGEGYLIEQVKQDWANNHIHKFVGSMEKRCRFALEVVKGVSEEIGAGRVGLKLTPFEQPDPEEFGVYMANALNHYGIAYLILSEPRVDKLGDRYDPHSLYSMRKAFKGTLIAVGGFKRDDGNKAIAENYADLIGYGRLFLANPDLPKRFELGAPLNKYDRNTFYSHDPVVGYTDYPFLDEISG